MKKIILLNGGKSTCESFALGVDDVPLEIYKTKETILHITSDLSLNFLNHGTSIDFSDSFVFTRLRAHDALFSGIIYEYLRDNNIPSSDPINLSFKFSEEKIAQMPRLARAKIQIPATIIAREESYAANYDYVHEHISYPIVYKTDGSKGEQVHLVDDIERLQTLIENKESHQLFMLQEYIPNTYDTRTLVAFDTILGSIKRSAQDGGFLNNVSQGGTVDPYKLTKAESAIALEATKVVGLDFGGVDIIHTDKGPYVLEVNKAPQIKGFESVYGEMTVFKRIGELIREKNNKA